MVVGTFTTWSGDDMQYYVWKCTAKPKAINMYVPPFVIVGSFCLTLHLYSYIHGAFSYGIDGERIGGYLRNYGITTYSFDQRGWGTWAKEPPGHLEDREHYLRDIDVRLFLFLFVLYCSSAG